jgi:hypothetical protein
MIHHRLKYHQAKIKCETNNTTNDDNNEMNSRFCKNTTRSNRRRATTRTSAVSVGEERGRRTSLFGNTRPTKSSLLIDEAIDRHADFAAARATITKRETFGLDSLPMMVEIRVQLTSNAVAVIELQHSNAFSIKAG